MNNLKSELKNTFTSYWQYFALRTACQLDIFDDIENALKAAGDKRAPLLPAGGGKYDQFLDY